jgi:hypothetical protein
VSQENLRFVSAAVTHATREGTTRVTEPLALTVDVTQYIVLAKSPQKLFGLVARKSICTFVPIKNSAVTIHKVHTIADVVEQVLVEAFIGWNHRVNAPFN